MPETNQNKLMNGLLMLSALAILLGALFKIQHYPYGNQLIWGGFMAQFIFSSIEMSRLKKIIKNLKEQKIVE